MRVLGRRDPGLPGVEFSSWEASREPSPQALEDTAAVIHLAGEPVAQRWNSDVKRRIRDSRVLGTRNLISAISKLRTRPRVLVAGSAIGYYGDRGDDILTEAAPPGKDFLAGVCVDWERESLRAREYGLRVALPRMGIVLGPDGGALKQMLPPFRAGLGGPAGSGKQWVSWIHIEDVVELLIFALSHDEITGPVNATAPNPIRNAEFAALLGQTLGRPSLIPTPALALRLLFGEMAEAVLSSQRVIPEAALRAGYHFRFGDPGAALRHILGSR